MLRAQPTERVRFIYVTCQAQSSALGGLQNEVRSSYSWALEEGLSFLKSYQLPFLRSQDQVSHKWAFYFSLRNHQFFMSCHEWAYVLNEPLNLRHLCPSFSCCTRMEVTLLLSLKSLNSLPNLGSDRQHYSSLSITSFEIITVGSNRVDSIKIVA